MVHCQQQTLKPTSETELKNGTNKTCLRRNLFIVFDLKNKIGETLKKEHHIPTETLKYSSMLEARLDEFSGKQPSNRERNLIFHIICITVFTFLAYMIVAIFTKLTQILNFIFYFHSTAFHRTVGRFFTYFCFHFCD